MSLSGGSTARSTTGRTVASASVGALLSLGAFIVVFAGFVVAPFVLLAAALLLYVAVRPREERSDDDASGQPGSSGPAAVARHHFGSGAR